MIEHLLPEDRLFAATRAVRAYPPCCSATHSASQTSRRTYQNYGSTHGQRTRCPNCSHSQHSPSTATATSSRVTRHVQPQTSSGYPVSGPTSIDVGAATPAMPGWVKPAGGQSRPSCRPRRLQGNQARKPVLDWSAPLDLNGLQSKLIRPALEAIGLPVSRPTVSNVQGGPSARRSWHRSTHPQK